MLVRTFFPPFRGNKKVRTHSEQFLEDQREALRGRFFQCQHFDVIVVYPEKTAMALQMGFTQVVVQKRVVFQTGTLDL